MFGAGCWVERSAGGRKVACSVSGQGELIVQSSLAKTLAERAAADTADDTHEILRSVVVDDFYGASAVYDAGFTSMQCMCVLLRQASGIGKESISQQ
jgi:taspase, threonine aspartase, 1